ncbi:MAG: GNAT family N-acetyltransferase [Massilibacteroides sp.]|nr:GNAT family N-acetyltransferase [Massilibacteroides sp.]MDD3061827.1 GNAT family N-acetyltransferase [Massilibacteroides sp.]MDD4114373.1 GNAT family N-acetyltransferase [Massilibacteroides sp.]MDD4660109.1 GNAT family N-acetyltransferase [Massilibacteroides sp.]
MREIISPVDKEMLKAELTKDKLLRRTNKSNNEIYIITAHDSPNVMREIGRLREIAFRYYGGGTGMDMDIDEYDTMDNAYRQLIVWSPEDDMILGGYRFLCGPDVCFDEQGKPLLATAHLFNFSETFIKDYLPYTVELGRSFVTLEYQSTRAGSKGLFVLDNLWDGLGALSVIDPTLKYFFGKVTMYNTYNTEARNMILYFLNLHFPDKDQLITPVFPLQTGMDLKKMEILFPHKDFKENYKILNIEVRKLGINVPPLVSAYMSLSPRMRTFGTAINHEFGEVEETGILIAINEILEEKKKRHIETYLKEEAQSKDLIKNAE